MTAEASGKLVGLVGDVPEDFAKTLCRFLKECTEEHDKQFPGGKPPRDWCKEPSLDPECETRAQERGKKIDECCTAKVKEFARTSNTSFAGTVKAQVGLTAFGHICRPDVIAGRPPNIRGVWDFKTSCPPLPQGAPAPAWPTYGDGPRDRKTVHKSWYGKTQQQIYREASGVDAVMIHENSTACK